MAARGRKGKRQFGDNGFGEWGGYMAAKKAKLEEQFSETKKNESVSLGVESKKGIFNGVSIFVNGYTGRHYESIRISYYKHHVELKCNVINISNVFLHFSSEDDCCLA